MADISKIQIESGTYNIKDAYLREKAITSYNSVNDMVTSNNLVINSLVKTNGYYSVNDGGGAYYYIREATNQDTPDGLFLISINNLIAEYIIVDNTINILQFGCKGDHSFDNTTILQSLITKCQTKGYVMLIPHGYFKITNTLYISNKITIKGVGNPRLWEGASIHSCIYGSLTNKPFFHISKNSTLYNWDTSANNIVEGVEISNLRIVGDEDENLSLTGIFASMYLSSIKNCTISGFLNDLALSSCYETIIDTVELMGSRQNLVMYNNNTTTVIKNLYCNGGNHVSGGVINDNNYLNYYTKNSVFNYTCVYINVGHQYFENLVTENSCYGIINKDANTYINTHHFENLMDYAIYNTVDLNANVKLSIDHAFFFNNSAYQSCKIYKNDFLGKLNIKTINKFPISNFVNDGDRGGRSISRFYSYISGEKVIDLTLSNNVSGATITNNSHFTETGFMIDYRIKNPTSWTDNIIANLSGLPSTNAYTDEDYFPIIAPNSNNTVVNVRVHPKNGNILKLSGGWIYGNDYTSADIVIHKEYKIS